MSIETTNTRRELGTDARVAAARVLGSAVMPESTNEDPLISRVRQIVVNGEIMTDSAVLRLFVECVKTGDLESGRLLIAERVDRLVMSTDTSSGIGDILRVQGGGNGKDSVSEFIGPGVPVNPANKKGFYADLHFMIQIFMLYINRFSIKYMKNI